MLTCTRSDDLYTILMCITPYVEQLPIVTRASLTVTCKLANKAICIDQNALIRDVITSVIDYARQLHDTTTTADKSWFIVATTATSARKLMISYCHYDKAYSVRLFANDWYWIRHEDKTTVSTSALIVPYCRLEEIQSEVMRRLHRNMSFLDIYKYKIQETDWTYREWFLNFVKDVSVSGIQFRNCAYHSASTHHST